MCVCSSQVERERKSARVRKRSFCSFFLIRAFSTERAKIFRCFDLSSDDDSNAKKAASLSRDLIKARDEDKKRTPPEIGFASRENLFS